MLRVHDFRLIGISQKAALSRDDERVAAFAHRQSLGFGHELRHGDIDSGDAPELARGAGIGTEKVVMIVFPPPSSKYGSVQMA